MSIKSDLDYLEETKGLIKEAIINKGQDIDANTPFRDYVDKIADISTEPANPLGVKVYKSVTINTNQTDLINYYVQGAQSGEFMDLNCFRFHFNYIDPTMQIPVYADFSITDTTPGLFSLNFYCYTTLIPPERSQMYYFSSSYTQEYIQIATSLGVYDVYVAAFLDRYNITETQLLQLNGWYSVNDNVLVTAGAPTIEHCNLSWIVKGTIQDFLTGNLYDVNQILNYVDIEETLLNTTLVEEDDWNSNYDYQRKLHGGFLQNSTADDQDILEDEVVYTHSGKVIGTMPNNGALNYTPSTSAQTIPSGYTSGGTIQAVTSSIDSDIVAGNIKTGVNILGVNGTFTSDANAVALDITENKTAYVNGQKITGSVPQYKSGTTAYGNGSAAVVKSYGVDITGDVSSVLLMRPGSYFETAVLNNTLATALNLTADKIKKDITILGVTGTYEGSGMKQYASVNDMNADIDNIANGEVVKVVESGTTTFYLKESEQIEIEGQVSVISEMKKLIKEEDTLSVNEYHEATDLSEDILGNE